MKLSSNDADIHDIIGMGAVKPLCKTVITLESLK